MSYILAICTEFVAPMVISRVQT
uniref:Uncharacterized protein n=1 Tax=Arundo donax TaxID=35708 RepID=A0A0A9BYY2_ARUDO